jgi:hypothetical protein
MHIPTHPRGRMIGLAVLAVAAAMIPAAALAATTSSAAGATATTPRCATAGLVIWMDTNGDGAAGSIFYTLKFTNLSGHACTLDGHPGVSAVSLGGGRIGRPAAWDPPKPQVVTLAAGATATAVLQYSDVTVSNHRCTTTAAGLRVYPPGQTASKVIPFPITACKSSTVVFMSVQPVQQG